MAICLKKWSKAVVSFLKVRLWENNNILFSMEYPESGSNLHWFDLHVHLKKIKGNSNLVYQTTSFAYQLGRYFLWTCTQNYMSWKWWNPHRPPGEGHCLECVLKWSITTYEDLLSMFGTNTQLLLIEGYCPLTGLLI